MIITDMEYDKIKYFLKTKINELEKETGLCPQLDVYGKLYKDMDKITDKERIKKLSSEYFINSKYKLLTTLHLQLISVEMYNAAKRNESILPYLYLLSLIYYNLILNRYIRYCDNNILSQSINAVKGTNLLKKYGVLKALEHISKSVEDLYSNFYNEFDDNHQILELMVYSLRTRVVQSLKSIVAKYYELKEKSKEVTSNNNLINTYINEAKYQILMLGNVPINITCKNYTNYLEKLKDVDEEILTKVLKEIFETLGIEPTQQKIIGLIDNLKEVDILNKYLHGPSGMKYCLIKTLIDIAMRNY